MTKKTFASFEQQIQHLEDKGIIISDRAYAEAMLKQIGYFPLIGGYKHLFRVPFTKTYKKGTTFEEYPITTKPPMMHPIIIFIVHTPTVPPISKFLGINHK